MRRALITLVAAASLVFLASAVSATPIPINTTDGTWVNGLPIGAATINNATPTRTARWGVPQGLEQSGYDWTPATTPFTADSNGAVFSLGTFNHQNFPILGTPITSIEMDFSLQIDGLAPINGTFHFAHDETPNALPCTYPSITPCADAVTITSPFLNTPFTYLGTQYFFSLLGFSQDGGVTTVTQFITQENQENLAGLYATITERPIEPVPEPATLLLLGSGLAACARLRRNRGR